MASATITSKGQITIPVQVREKLGLEPGDRIEFVQTEPRKFEIVPVTGSVRDLKGMLYKKGRKPVSIEEMNAAVAWAASQSNGRSKR
ncbi:MAG TPA: AbrB/MazE/SpoVT family DNA-binding domain-containing protein [Candidatus Sulfotelmatobacter sp.]|jgi:AbrB family looped-hinge helix DNA binding protein